MFSMTVSDNLMLGIIGGVGPYEMIVLGIIALLLFGKRLPEVARSMGKGIVEFKKGMAGIEDEVRSAGTTNYSSRSSSSSSATTASRPAVESDEQKWEAPRFEPQEQSHA